MEKGVTPNFKSVAMLQSELGVTGDCSPNVMIHTDILKMSKKIKFTSDLSQEDAIICISQFYAGKKVNGDECFASGTLMVGSEEDQYLLIEEFFINNPSKMSLFSEAMASAIQRLNEQ